MEKIAENEIVKIATMYYEEGMTQSEIARKRGVSRSLISKIIVEAKRDGIVEIVINSSSVYTAKLERELEEKYQLKNAIVIDTFNLNKDEIKKIASQQAGLYLKKIAPRYKKIGLSWGNSLRGLVDSFPYTNHQEATILPLIGGLSDDYFDIQSNQLSYDLARKMRAKAKYLYSPALVSNPLIREELSNNNAIQSILEAGKEVDLALIGISSLDQESNMRRLGFLSEEDATELKGHNAVGVINSRFFNQEGKEVDSEINKNVIGLNLEELRKIPAIMTVVYGDQKVEAIRAALESELLNIIVTTDTITEGLLGEEY
ncbi:sugar-binding transcriptional regulator [Ruoffia tabacinasalis]|uniref:Sugar-binding transcriptional regulator n=1 Tax=Ruoffia tabacinasalis TaxID=87458 RepID=A0A5R9DVM7_9LACT|nr:sugar-binding transcriptional regulator [Ruoffia tabacinasalis]TLQ40809.1 sugar-binding transcriptional regulator [Ruoffia tabacinasalis]